MASTAVPTPRQGLVYETVSVLLAIRQLAGSYPRFGPSQRSTSCVVIPLRAL